jgi:hypothetical protein
MSAVHFELRTDVYALIEATEKIPPVFLLACHQCRRSNTRTLVGFLHGHAGGHSVGAVAAGDGLLGPALVLLFTDDGLGGKQDPGDSASVEETVSGDLGWVQDPCLYQILYLVLHLQTMKKWGVCWHPLASLLLHTVSSRFDCAQIPYLNQFFHPALHLRCLKALMSAGTNWLAWMVLHSVL